MSEAEQAADHWERIFAGGVGVVCGLVLVLAGFLYADAITRGGDSEVGRVAAKRWELAVDTEVLDTVVREGFMVPPRARLLDSVPVVVGYRRVEDGWVRAEDFDAVARAAPGAGLPIPVEREASAAGRVAEHAPGERYRLLYRLEPHHAARYRYAAEEWHPARGWHAEGTGEAPPAADREGPRVREHVRHQWYELTVRMPDGRVYGDTVPRALYDRVRVGDRVRLRTWSWGSAEVLKALGPAREEEP
ncbi:MAG TPA: hypothetical protein VFX98_15735 [Longimicrobiaceae bacterium]|nr:hypothetical protein [Longimicrobiaceae bacterium]